MQFLENGIRFSLMIQYCSINLKMDPGRESDPRNVRREEEKQYHEELDPRRINPQFTNPAYIPPPLTSHQLTSPFSTVYAAPNYAIPVYHDNEAQVMNKEAEKQYVLLESKSIKEPLQPSIVESPRPDMRPSPPNTYRSSIVVPLRPEHLTAGPVRVTIRIQAGRNIPGGSSFRKRRRNTRRRGVTRRKVKPNDGTENKDGKLPKKRGRKPKLKKAEESGNESNVSSGKEETITTTTTKVSTVVSGSPPSSQTETERSGSDQEQGKK